MFFAQYFDGVTARSEPVTVKVSTDKQCILFATAAQKYEFSFAEISVQAKLGKAKRIIDLPNGGTLEADEISMLEAAMPSRASAFWRWLHYLENHLGWVAVSFVFTFIAGWAFLQYGVPVLAENVAKATPPSIEKRLGEQVLTGLDGKYSYFSPSKIDKNRQASLSKQLNTLCAATANCPQYQLNYRHGGLIGANAFALPGGYLVVTDELIELAENDNEIIAVLAHELGHVKERHAFRQSLQGVLAGLIVTAVSGDVSAVASSLPAVLMQMRYSRTHETEADTFALNSLQKACLPTKAFADILQRLTDAAGGELPTDKKNQKAEKTDVLNEMLSSHPDTKARIKPFLAAKQRC